MSKKKFIKNQVNDFVTLNKNTAGNEFFDFLKHEILPSSVEEHVEIENKEIIESSVEEKKNMILRVWVDKKNRGGKEVTLVRGFTGYEHEAVDLTKYLKAKCGIGGATKDGEIILQGNHKLKVIEILLNLGYKNTRGAGG